MKKLFLRVVAPSWSALYVILFRGFGAWAFVSLMLMFNVLTASLVMIFLYWVWGVIFYLILLESDSFEHFKATLERLLEDKKGKMFVWLKKTFFHNGEQPSISPALIMAVFVIESPLTGVPLVRFAFARDRIWIGIFWITAGSVLEVLTWFLPIYGGGLAVIKGLFFWITA